MFRFAHISDIHMPPLPRVAPHDLLNKRVLGYLSWHRNRKYRHRAVVLEALARDLKAQAPDHICVTGDLTNIALPGEFEHSVEWLGGLGPAERVSVIPGNHDAYIPEGLRSVDAHWKPWMGDGFPYVHRRGLVAFIGVSSAIATGPFMAYGRVGDAQLVRLQAVLTDLKAEGLQRVIMIHHPPQEGVSGWRKGLHDRAAFRAVIARAGAEGILHGHLHHPVYAEFDGPDGRSVPVYGAGSASVFHESPRKAAHYHVFECGENALQVSHRYYDAGKSEFVTLEQGEARDRI
ncbi:MAG: metallophosphoesterase [Alphaproteobacteria bacterium]